MRHETRRRWAAGLLSIGMLLGTAQAQDIEPALRAARLQPGEQIRLDGRLDHPAWQRATPHDRFVEKDPPRPGEAVPQRTQVQVLFDDRAVYIGVIAFDDRPAAMRDVPVRFDGVNRTQDFVVAYLDPIGQRRSAQFFRVNAAGSLADGIHTAADDSEDFAPDFDWDAAVHRRPDGWSAVMRIPFATLRFAEAAAGQPWRFMLARRLPREHFHLLTSVDVPRSAPSFIDRLQPLVGIELPAEHRFWSLRPSVTLRRTEGPDGVGVRREWHHELGLDLKWRPRAELVIDGTWKPDFSQVALDVPQLSGNSRFALFLDEKRPFFFESADLLRSPTDAFYTRSITQPRGGLRATWRSSELAGTALVADDRGGGLVLLPGPYGTDAANQPGSRVLATRWRREGLGSGAMLGGLLALRRYEDGRGDNQVAGLDGDMVPGDGWRLRAQLLASNTTALPQAGNLQRGPAESGHRAYAWLQHLGASSESWLVLDDVSDGFRHDTGFVNQSGVQKVSARHTWRHGGIGPFHMVDTYIEARGVHERRRGERVESDLFPAVWLLGASNLEWWAEWHPLARARTREDGPLHHTHFVVSGLVYTPALWWPLLDTQLTVGRLADAVADRVRPGARWRFSARLRPLRMLEVDPSLSRAWLVGDGPGRPMAYHETAAQVLAVWHLDGRQYLRLIVQRSSLDRKAEPQADAMRSTQRSESVTYQWRRPDGVQLFVGLSQQRDAAGPAGRSREAFVKLQWDMGSGH